MARLGPAKVLRHQKCMARLAPGELFILNATPDYNNEKLWSGGGRAQKDVAEREREIDREKNNETRHLLA
jgi:hypothetical protein